jgi:UDP-N-acetylglucosamine pyrophosphorylase
MNKDATLLCTFSNINDYQRDISIIFETYSVFKNTIFVLQDKQDASCVFLTYNLRHASRAPLKNTSLMHRKKSVNAIYSINALNEIVKLEVGFHKKHHEISWETYKNSILLYRNNKLAIIPTKLLLIHRKT